jgi:hypothetical protein
VWIASTTGFLSAVLANDSTTDLYVRARVKGDLDALIKYAEDATTLRPEIVTYEASDYPWRVRVDRYTFGAFLAEQAIEGITYGNFKNAVAEVQGKPRANVYSGVWSALLGLERLDPEARPVSRPWWATYGDDALDYDDLGPRFSDTDEDDDDDWMDVDEWLSRSPRRIQEMTDEEWLANEQDPTA